MALNAFKDGLTVFNQTNMNALLSLQDFKLIYDGTIQDSMVDAGSAEMPVRSYSVAIKFTTGSGKTEVTRLDLDLSKSGIGADLTVEIRGNDFNPTGSNEGTLLKTVVVPKEFLPAVQAYWSIPINLTGLTAATVYWIIVKKAGDTTNHVQLHSKGSEKDAAHKCYWRVGTTGAWTDFYNSARFKIYEGVAGSPVHEVYGTNGYVTIVYATGVPTIQYFYLPPSDGVAGGVRSILTLAYSGSVLTGGVVT